MKPYLLEVLGQLKDDQVVRVIKNGLIVMHTKVIFARKLEEYWYYEVIGQEKQGKVKVIYIGEIEK